MPPAARVGDLHACPAHVGGPVTAGSATVNIGGQPAARVGDQSSCRGSRDTIVQGSPTVFIEGRPAARSGDRCAHTGVIVTGFPTVIIGNEGSGGGGTSAGGASGAPGDPTGQGAQAGAVISGTMVTTKVVSALVSLARQLFPGGGAPANTSAIQTIATALEVALARNDTGAIAAATGQLQKMLQQHRGAEADKPKEAAAASSPGPALGWQKGTAAPAEPPRSVEVRDGRVAINGRFTGIHAISEFDLIELQAGGRIEQVVQRLVVASAAGRNCVRVFCMYKNARGTLLPWTTDGYWTAVDAVVKRLAAYGLLGEFVLLADCDRRADGSGGAMPSWKDRRVFAREAGQFFKGKPVIVCGMNEPASNGAAAADDPQLVDVMVDFREASAGTVPFSIGDPPWPGADDIAVQRPAQQSLAASGASILVVHSPRQQPNDRRYRWWIDRLRDFADLRAGGLSGNPYLYHSEPMGFASHRDAGMRENDPEAAVAAACICAAGQMGFCYHRIASEDAATPGLELTRMATLIPQSPEFLAYTPGASGAPIERFNEEDFPGGAIYGCSNGAEAWAVGYARKLAKAPRVDWRGFTPSVIWRGERVVLWRAAP